MINSQLLLEIIFQDINIRNNIYIVSFILFLNILHRFLTLAQLTINIKLHEQIKK